MKTGKNVTIKDIARELGVSFSCVAKALNDNPLISEKRRQLVKAKAEELNYRPNFPAKCLAAGKSMSIGYVIPDILEVFSPDITRGIEETLTENNYFTIFCQSAGSGKREAEIIRNLLKLRIDGLLILPALKDEEVSKELYAKLLKDKFPFVLIDHNFPDIKSNTVVTNDAEITTELTEFVIGRGRKKPAFIKGPPNAPNAQKRMEGYKKALRKHGIKIRSGFITGNNYSVENGYESTLRLLEKREKPDALICANDKIAEGAYKALNEKKIRVPDDIAVSGFGCIESAKKLYPALTSVLQPTRELGKKAAELLLGKIKKYGRPEILTIDSELSIGESV